MKDFICACAIFGIGFTMGMLFDSDRMANDPEFHDYWMKRCKKTD